MVSAMGTVLVIDDQLELRTLFQRVLENGGHRVVTVGDGEAALHATANWTPDLILLDLSMPRVDGLGFLERLKEHPHAPEFFVIVTSGSEEASAAESHPGVLGRLAKPFGLKELLSSLNTAA